VGWSLEQPALAMAVRQSAKINRLYLKPMVALDAMGQVERGMLIMEVVARSERVSVAVALLALGTRLFNGDCAAAPEGCSVLPTHHFPAPKPDTSVDLAQSAPKIGLWPAPYRIRWQPGIRLGRPENSAWMGRPENGACPKNSA